MSIPVIDLFAGPGGLSEGFSSVLNRNKRQFEIRLSIEMEANAHETLLFRSFYRQFPVHRVPDEYYDVLKEKDSIARKELRDALFNKYPKESKRAEQEAWHFELKSSKESSNQVNIRIREALKGEKRFILIGGPPCQAYSLVGRSRVGGISKNDHRVYLYKQYLRIIAEHQPVVFVMENVKGLLSSKIEGVNVFDKILSDLRNPASVFKSFDSKKYRIYSLVKKPMGFDKNSNPIYAKSSDFVIKSENYQIPQCRHRVILLGIREDINVEPEILRKFDKTVTIKEVIRDLPKIRSSISRVYVGKRYLNRKQKRVYKNVEDSSSLWNSEMDSFYREMQSWNGNWLHGRKKIFRTKFKYDIGSEFLKYKTPRKDNPLYDWYIDEKLKGVCNHQSRSHLLQDLKRYLFSSLYAEKFKTFPRISQYLEHSEELMPDHSNILSGKFTDRFRVQVSERPATTITSHISKDGHYYIHYDPSQCRSLTVREAARIQTFPDNYLFCGSRTAQLQQVGNAVPPLLAKQIGQIVLNVLLKNV